MTVSISFTLEDELGEELNAAAAGRVDARR
jgi:hypothetical protein